ncbi:MAG: DNA polymerase IV [Chlamydiota bacterium]|nr:DNA polymerase IV [Chlamydiota bacterium]
MSPRVILHVDMDAFFASVEQKSNPSLRGRPVAVIGQRKRTIIVTSSYEARRYGIKTGMRPFEAKRLCPHIIFVEADQAKYTDTATRLVRILEEITPRIEVYSVDEMFLDLSDTFNQDRETQIKIKADIPASFEYARIQACLIKKKILQELGLSCSIGIAPNKLMAKLASDQSKPDGLTLITPDAVAEYLEDLPVGDLCGVGARTEKSLSALGIRTCGQLGRADVGLLRYTFGIYGQMLYWMGQGIDPRPVVSMEHEPNAKSVGHSMTLKKDIHDPEEIKKFLLELCEKVGRRLRRACLSAGTMTLSVRYSDFSSFSVQQVLPDRISRSCDIFKRACRIFERLRLKQAVRLLGVSLSDLCESSLQGYLWHEEQEKDNLQSACDRLNNVYGEFSVYPALLLRRAVHPGAISPAWRPTGVRRVMFS